jgi:DNA-directed RNA polymerase subunit RPC12/RpoP
MRISRDSDGLRFIGECAAETGFVSRDIRCLTCARRIDPRSEGPDVILKCTGCGFKSKLFRSEAELKTFLAKQWDLLRQACTHPSVTTVRQ